MTTQEKLLSLFETHKGTYFSGEEIAKQLEISRSAVWKAIKILQNKGYSIKAITNKGYCLSEDTDILSKQGIEKYLKSSDFDINVIPVTSSTNTLIRAQAIKGSKEGYVVIANEQTAGRGRLGRSFYSPSKTGIYMSILLRPKHFLPSHAIKITTIAAVAVCRAIESVCQKNVLIKWVNDIFFNGKKVSGISTEATMDLENGMVDYMILGIGINLYQPKDNFPNELEQIATALFSSPQSDMKNHLTAEVLNNFMSIYKNIDDSNYVKEYKERSLATGKRVKLIFPTTTKEALVLGINDECQLIVRYDDNHEELISTGEISIRL